MSFLCLLCFDLCFSFQLLRIHIPACCLRPFFGFLLKCFYFKTLEKHCLPFCTSLKRFKDLPLSFYLTLHFLVTHARQGLRNADTSPPRPGAFESPISTLTAGASVRQRLPIWISQPPVFLAHSVRGRGVAHTRLQQNAVSQDSPRPANRGKPGLAPGRWERKADAPQPSPAGRVARLHAGPARRCLHLRPRHAQRPLQPSLLQGP